MASNRYFERAKFAARPHGTRLRYLGGCRCLPCRAANSRYSSHRLREIGKGRWNGVVDAAPAREKLQQLSAKGMGYKRVAVVAKISRTTLQKIMSGKRGKVRALALQRILETKFMPAPAAVIAAGPTWKLLNELIADGWPKYRLAVLLGATGGGLQIRKDFVLARTAVKVWKLHKKLMPEASERVA